MGWLIVAKFALLVWQVMPQAFFMEADVIGSISGTVLLWTLWQVVHPPSGGVRGVQVPLSFVQAALVKSVVILQVPSEKWLSYVPVPAVSWALVPVNLACGLFRNSLPMMWLAKSIVALAGLPKEREVFSVVTLTIEMLVGLGLLRWHSQHLDVALFPMGR